MAFFPILKAPHVTGVTCISNFPPNDWETKYKGILNLYVTYIKDGLWHNEHIDILPYNSFKTITLSDIAQIVNDKSLPLLSLNFQHLPKISRELPEIYFPRTQTPSWRATLGLRSESSVTSFQGEIFPFPPQASLLTFAPFIQLGKDIENYVLLMNIEKEALYRDAEVEIFDAYSKKLLATESVSSNKINIISLDNLGLNDTNLPVIICRKMAFVPLYFSITTDGTFMSLEHTHPPAELVVFGKKFGAQKHLKELWFSLLKK